MDNGAQYYRRFIEGDDEAVRTLIDLYYDDLALYLRTYLKNLNDAEEIAEQTFVTLVTRKPVYTGRSTFKTFLYSIGRHHALDFIRSNSGRHTEPIENAEPVSDEDIEQNYIKEERKRALWRAMGRLKDDYRQILWLTYFDELPCPEAAKAMDKSVIAAEHLLRRAKKALRDEMKKEGYTE